MELLMIGGGLQGMEVCYLARKAGHETTLVDKTSDPIARNLADEFHQLDVTKDRKRARQLAEKSDFVIPTTENIEALKSLERMGKGGEAEILFDFESFFRTANKRKMYELLSNSVRAPPGRSESSPPWIAKPVFGSGSEGIVKLDSVDDLERFERSNFEEEYIVQKFVKGLKYSTEAIATGDELYIYETTLLEFDEGFGCCRVICDPSISEDTLNAQEITVRSIYDNFNSLRHLFDVQTVYSSGEMTILEINTRFPSQTPMAVYWSSGINLLDQMLNPSSFDLDSVGCVILEHFIKKPDDLKKCSEGVLLRGKRYKICSDLEHCTEAILGRPREGKGKIGTVIFVGNDLKAIEKEREMFYDSLRL